MGTQEFNAIKQRLSFTGDTATDHEDAVALSKEVERLRKALQAIAATAGLNGTTAAKIVRFAKMTLDNEVLV